MKAGKLGTIIRKNSQRLHFDLQQSDLKKNKKTVLSVLKGGQTIKSQRPTASLREANGLQTYVFAFRMCVYSLFYLFFPPPHLPSREPGPD